MLLSLVGALPLYVSAAGASIEIAAPAASGDANVTFNISGSVSGSWVAIYKGDKANGTSYVDYVMVNTGDGTSVTFPSNDSQRMKDPSCWPLGGTINAGEYLAVLYDKDYGILAQTPFTVTGGVQGTTSFKIGKTKYTVGEDVTFTYENSKYDNDWIGIYPEGSTAYGNNWKYTVGSSGTVSFKNLAVGKYTAKYFENEKSDAASIFGSIDFEVVEETGKTTFSIEKTEFTVGEDIVFTYKNTQSDTDWIGIYPDGSDSYGLWGYTPTGSGTWTASGLTAGGYTAKFFYHGYSDAEHMYGSIHFTVKGGETPDPDPEPTEPSITLVGKVSAGAANVTFNVTGFVSGSWVALYHGSRNIAGEPSKYDDYVDVNGKKTVIFPSGQAKRQRFDLWPLGGTISEGSWTAILYDSSYGELARTTFEAVDDRTTFAVEKTLFTKGETVTFTYKKSHNENDFIAIYAENGDTILEQKDTPNESGSVIFAGSWTKTPGNYTAKYYAAGSTDTLLATTVFTILGDDAPAAGDGVYFLMYGGTGNGKDPSDPAGSVDTVFQTINGDGYGEGDDVILYVMDAPDALTYRPSSAGRGKTDSHLTAWGNPSTAHTATVHVKGYLGVNSHIVTQQKFGDQTSASATGPVVFEDITFVRSRLYDEGMTASGFSITVTPETVIKSYSSDFGKVGDTWDGKFNDAYMTFILGSEPASKLQGDHPYVSIDNTNSNGAEFYFASWYETHSPYTESATLAIRNLKGKCVIWYSGNKDVTFKKAANILVGEAPEMTSFKIDKGSVTPVHEGAFQFIVNKHNPVAANYVLPSWIGANGGIYRMNVDRDLLEFTDNDGIFYCSDYDLVAVATDETGMKYYSDAEGYLTVPAGTYDVTFVDAESMADRIVAIYCGPGSYTSYKGENFILPKQSDTPFSYFKGYKYVDTDNVAHVYKSGDAFPIPADFEGDFILIDEIWEAVPGVVGVYLSKNGSDENDGATRDRAVATFNQAYALLKNMTGDKKMIVVTGNYPFTGGFPETNEMLTITGDGTGTSVLDLYSDYIVMKGPITFENIKLSQTTTQGGKRLATYGHELVIGEGVEQAAKPMLLRFGTMSPTSLASGEKVTLKSGTFKGIELGSFYNYDNPGSTAGAEIVIDGAEVEGIALTSDGWLGTHRGNYFTKDVRITVNSGSLGSVTGTLGNPESSRAVGFKNGAKLYVLINNSSVKPTFTDFSSAAPAGAWSVYCGGKEGATLSYTDTDGVYKVNGAKYALATSNDGKQILSNSGTITLPSGAWTVELSDSIRYLFDGETVTVYSDCTIDLSTFTPDTKDGMLFIGWTLADGTPAKMSDTYKEGDTITAQYLAYDTATGGDFFIKGAQIRTEGEQGLRFILEKKNSFADSIPEVIDFGALVLPTDYTHGHDMKYGESLTNEYVKGLPSGVNPTTWQYNTPAIVKANKLYKETDDGVQYTLCITGIDEERYWRYYSVKGYIRYRDLNGNDAILYSDYYQTNLYQVALAALAAGETPTATFEGIKTYVEVDRKNEYMAEQYDGRTPLADAKNGAAVSWRETEGSATVPGVTNKDYYALKNGLKVREVEFDFNTSGKDRDDITIIHFADTHLNSINDKDWAEADPCILSTYRGRSWNRNGSSVPAINTVMEYASFYDKTVITGDIMDYFSWGCAEMIQKLIIDKDKSAILTIGNHEPARLMQPDDSSLRDNMPIEEKYARIQSMWPQNVKYYSEILKNDDGENMVMVVSMDNQRYGYWEDQIEPLTADIERARSLGIKMLFFQHCPVCTIPGGGEDWVTFFYEPGDTSGMTVIDGVKHTNFGASNFAGSATKYEGANKAVYDLITSNADVVAGLFCGDWHVNMYTEIQGKTPSGEKVMIPQYVVTANAYAQGSAIKITIK